MIARRVVSVFVLGWLGVGVATAREEIVDAPITSVGLFKNGVAVVKREVTLPAAGEYMIRDVVEPIHGTFFIESDATVDVRVTQRDLEVPADFGVDLQEELRGRAVTVYFSDERLPLEGVVVKQAGQDKETAWDRNYDARPGGWSGSRNLIGASESSKRRYLVLETDRGVVYVDPTRVVSIEASSRVMTTTRRVPVMILSTSASAAANVSIHYLTKGIAWAASYRIDTTDPSRLVLEQHATVKNELADLSNAKIQLISGYPSVEFAHVLSPLAPTTTWANFFQQLNQSPGDSPAVTSNRTRQAVSNVANFDSGPMPDAPVGEGVDLHYQPIDARTLLEGDVLHLRVARSEADYQRVTEWAIQDTRDANGRLISESRWGQATAEDEELWDAIRFRNPLPYPMTTGAATVVESGRFSGERTSTWVNPGQRTLLRVNRALSIEADHSEYETDEERLLVERGGTKYWRTAVKGELRLMNHRKTAADVVVRRRFSGELREADLSPAERLREEGVYSVNRRGELEWEITLQPGEEKIVTYLYDVLVRG